MLHASWEKSHPAGRSAARVMPSKVCGLQLSHMCPFNCTFGFRTAAQQHSFKIGTVGRLALAAFSRFKIRSLFLNPHRKVHKVH